MKFAPLDTFHGCGCLHTFADGADLGLGAVSGGVSVDCSPLSSPDSPAASVDGAVSMASPVVASPVTSSAASPVTSGSTSAVASVVASTG